MSTMFLVLGKVQQTEQEWERFKYWIKILCKYFPGNNNPILDTNSQDTEFRFLKEFFSQSV